MSTTYMSGPGAAPTAPDPAEPYEGGSDMSDLICPECGFVCHAKNGLVLHVRGHRNVPKMCSVDGCDRPHVARGVCGRHYQRLQKFGSVELPVKPPRPDLFWASVEKTEAGCWHFIGHVAGTGYGYFALGGGRNMLAHRYSYELSVGPIPDGMDLDHVCHSIDKSCAGGPCLHRRCVNPDHLEPVTRRENLRRGRGGFGKSG